MRYVWGLVAGIAASHLYDSTQGQQMARYVVGIDAGRSRHAAAVLDTDRHHFIFRGTFAVSREGFDQLYAELRNLQGSPGSVLMAVEASGGYHLTLVDDLLEHQYAVQVVSPHRASSFRKAEGHRAKSDKIDAASIARFVASMPADGPRATQDQYGSLRELVRFREQLAYSRIAEVNRLGTAVALSFPEFASEYTRLHTKIVLSLFEAYPGADALAWAEPADILATLKKQGGRISRERLERLQHLARTSVGLGPRQKPLELKIRTLVGLIRDLDQRITEFEGALGEEFARLGLRVEDFPCGSVVSLATIIGAMRSVEAFRSQKQLLSYFGWCPEDRQSGESELDHPRLSKAGSRSVRRVLWMLAMNSILTPGIYKTYYERRVAAGKSKMHSLIAVARKILCAIFAILKSGRPFDPALYETSGKAPASA